MCCKDLSTVYLFRCFTCRRLFIKSIAEILQNIHNEGHQFIDWSREKPKRLHTTNEHNTTNFRKENVRIAHLYLCI